MTKSCTCSAERHMRGIEGTTDPKLAIKDPHLGFVGHHKSHLGLKTMYEIIVNSLISET